MRDLTDAQIGAVLTDADLSNANAAQAVLDLRYGADHIDRVGWFQGCNYQFPFEPSTSPCCAIGSIYRACEANPSPLRHEDSTFGGLYRTYAAEDLFTNIWGWSLLNFNDADSTTKEMVTSAMRQVADRLHAYLVGVNYYA